MNQIYKVVFSHVHRCFVAASELTKSRGRGSCRTARLKGTATALATRAMGSLLFLGMGLAVIYHPSVQADALNVYGNSYITAIPDNFASAWGVGSQEYPVTASGEGATAFGWGTVADGNESTAFGYKTKAAGDYATTWGVQSQATAIGATAWGGYILNAKEVHQGGNAYGLGATAFGSGTWAEGTLSTAWGSGTSASGENATAWGYQTQATAAQATAWGANTSADAAHATAWGANTSADAAYATAWGDKTTASGESATALGYGSEASGAGAMAWGGYYFDPDTKETGGMASGSAATAFGLETKAVSEGATAFGYLTQAGQLLYGKEGSDQKEASIVSYTDTENNIAVTKFKIVDAQNGTTLKDGYATYFQAYNDDDLIIEGREATAFGYRTKATGNYAMALGENTTANTTGSMAWGHETLAGNDGKSKNNIGFYSTAFGYRTKATGDSSTAFGVESNAQAENSLAALGGTVVYDESDSANIVNAKNSAAIGKGAKVTVADTVALGSGSVASREKGAEDAYLKGSNTGAAWESTHNAIAVGDDATVTRQITGVAAGSKDTDAVNVAQLSTVYKAVESKADTSLSNITDKGKGVIRDLAKYTASQDVDPGSSAGQGSTTFTVTDAEKQDVGSMSVWAGDNVIITQKTDDNGKIIGAVVNATDTKYTLTQETTGNQAKIILTGNDGSATQTATIAGGKGITITGDTSKATIAVDTAAIKAAVDTNTTYHFETKAGDGSDNVVSKTTVKSSTDGTTYTETGETFSDTDTKITSVVVDAGTKDAAGKTTYTVTLTDNDKNRSVDDSKLKATFDVIDTDTTYTAGTNVGISADNKISAADSRITGTSTGKDGAGNDTYTINYQTDTAQADGTIKSSTTAFTITDKDTNTHTSVNGTGYVAVNKTAEATADAGPTYQVSLNTEASGAIQNANTYLNSSGFKADDVTVNSDGFKAGDVTVNSDGFKAGDVTVNSDGFKVGSSGPSMTADGIKVGDVTVNRDGFKVGSSGPSMTADGINAGGKKITNVADGTEAGDAVNYRQLQQVDQKITSQDDALKKLAHRDAQLERKIYRAGAHAAAIAALHPLDYDEDHKFTAAAGIGQYHGSSAMAVGAFYRPTENLMFSVGASLNENDSMVNAGLSYRFGTGSGNKTSPNNIHEMKRQINNLSEENRLLSAKLDSSESKLASADARIASSDAEIKELKTRLRQIEKLLKLK